MNLSIVDDSGSSHDLEISAREPMPWATLRQACPHPLVIKPNAQMFNQGKLILDHNKLGTEALSQGSVLTTRRRQPPADRSTLSLSVDAGPDAGAVFPLRRGQHVVGRGADADITINDPDLSRRHLSIDVGLHTVAVRDLASTNGTTCDGRRIDDAELAWAPGTSIIAGHSQLSLSGIGEPPAVTEADDTGRTTVHRPPRQGLCWQPRTYDLPDPPAQLPRPRLSWLAAAVPALASVGLAVIFRSPQLLAFAALTPVSVVASALTDRRAWRRDQRRKQEDYDSALTCVRADIAEALAEEDRVRRRTFSGPSDLLHSATGPDCRLWERRRSDGDFLSLRVGLGDVDSETSTRIGGRHAPAAPLRLIPVVADLTVGALGLAGPTDLVRASARFLTVQLLARYSPVDVQVLALIDTSGSRSWRWLRWSDAHLVAAARTEDERAATIENLLRIFDERLSTPRSDDARWAGPWLVLIVDPAIRIAQLSRVGELLAEGHRVGITAICLAEEVRSLPSACATTLDADPDADGWARLSGAQRSEQRLSLDAVGEPWCEVFARALAPLRDADVAGENMLPTEQRLSDLMGWSEFRPDQIRQNWQREGPVIAQIGVSGSGAFGIDLVKDGPHLLVAGTTGSGKSELLRTFVASLACAHSPDRLSFVLVDYKGGAAFAECTAFPHVLGLVTDLDEQLTRRALTSLDAELSRRENAFAQAGVADLESFHRSPKATDITLSRLVLVIDEFATLVEELPDFINGLLGIAQRGRSLGVHLVLATQRPAGVLSPDIKANMSLRIALRVTDAAESSDVINDVAASRISRQVPGRAFARRTDGDLIEFQAAGVSLPLLEVAQVQVRLLDEWNRPVREADSASITTELQAISSALTVAAADLTLPPRPWLDPLPDVLGHRPRFGSHQLELGLLDEPEKQRQSAITHDLDSGGVIALIGGARSGRTTALRSTLGLATAQLTPDQLHMYVIDFDGGLRRVAELAHCGTYVDSTDPARVVRLISRLSEHAAARRRLLAEAGVSGATEARDKAQSFPAVLIAIDGWDALTALSDEFDAGRSADALIQLMREAASAGISVVVTGDRGLLAARVSAVLNRKLVLPLTNVADYALAGVAPTAVPIDPRPGRGVDAVSACQFLLALTGSARNVSGQWDVIVSAARGLGGRSTGPAIQLRPLPISVRAADVESPLAGFLLGVGGDEAQPIECDLLGVERQFLIAGPARSGKSSAAILIASQAEGRGIRVIVAATTRSPLAQWARMTGVPVLTPSDMAVGLDSDLVVLDDAEQFVDTPAGEDLLKLVASDDIAAVVTARSDDLLVSFRGLGVEMRRHRTGLLLQPSAVDGELLGVRIPRRGDLSIPGRGVLVTDRTRSEAAGYVTIQLAQV